MVFLSVVAGPVLCLLLAGWLASCSTVVSPVNPTVHVVKWSVLNDDSCIRIADVTVYVTWLSGDIRCMFGVCLLNNTECAVHHIQ